MNITKQGLIIGIILLLGAGFWFGYLLAPGKEAPQAPAGEAEEEAAAEAGILETSKVIKSRNAIAEGLVTKIQGRTLTLFAEDETLDIPIREDAKVVRQFLPGGQISVQTENIEFAEIKTGDQVRIVIGLTEEGFEGKHITVLLP